VNFFPPFLSLSTSLPSLPSTRMVNFQAPPWESISTSTGSSKSFKGKLWYSAKKAKETFYIFDSDVILKTSWSVLWVNERTKSWWLKKISPKNCIHAKTLQNLDLN
jgi:hypothetical protein